MPFFLRIAGLSGLLLLFCVGGTHAQDWESDGVNDRIEFNSSDGAGLDFTPNSDGSHWLWVHDDGSSNPTQYGAQLYSAAGEVWRIENRSSTQELMHLGTDGSLYVQGNIESSGVNPRISRLYQADPLSDYPKGLTVMGSESQHGWDWVEDASTVLTVRHSNYARSTQFLVSYDSEMYLRKPSSDEVWKDWVRVIVEDEETGNVGINTDDPPEALSVAGNVQAEEVIVKSQSDWPDYVFDPGYDLRSPAELAAFIDREGHLPALPSAETVEAEGQTVGEVQRGLVQTVEELARYAINQRERAAAQANRVRQLERQQQAQRQRLRRLERQVETLRSALQERGGGSPAPDSTGSSRRPRSDSP